MNALLAQVKASASKLKDQTAEKPTFEKFIIPAGRALARFVSYVEIGKRPQPDFQGKAKPPAQEVRLGFELVGNKMAREVEFDGVKSIIYPMIHVKLPIKAGDKASFTKLLKKMQYGRDGITHMAMMLGEGFIVTVVHNKGKDKAGNEVTFQNIKTGEGEWLVAAPMVLVDANDPECNEYKPVPVPGPFAPIQLLLWDDPSKEQWESIFIDGTRESKNAKGEAVTVSKNWIQEDIVKSAMDFDGSALQALLLEMAGGMELDGGAGEALDGGDLDGGDDLGEGDLPATDEPARPATAGTADASGDDPLAELGFNGL